MRESGRRDPGRGRKRERGVTTILNYALLLVVVAIVVSGLFVGVGEFVENQQERAIGAQLETVGDRLAGDITTADRVVRTANTSAPTTVRLQSQLPETVGGSQYLITISGSDPRYEITLQSVNPEVETSVVVRSTVGLGSGTVQGGPLVVEYASGQLEVRSADG